MKKRETNLKSVLKSSRHMTFKFHILHMLTYKCLIIIIMVLVIFPGNVCFACFSVLDRKTQLLTMASQKRDLTIPLARGPSIETVPYLKE